MVDFENLRRITKIKPKPIDPLEIFRRLSKPPGINDLSTSQAEVLQAWFSDRSNQNTYQYNGWSSKASAKTVMNDSGLRPHYSFDIW